MGIITRCIPQSYLWGEFILIFVCVGSREYQFNRLLKKIDDLIDNGHLEDEVFAQIGQSTYKPVNYRYARFLTQSEFKMYQEKAHLIISHGGTGALIGALKLGKQVIAVPRLALYGEHIDDHQVQVASVLDKEGYLICVLDIKDLKSAIHYLKKNPINKKYNRPSEVVDIIINYINEN